jgi:protein Tex
MDKLDEVELTGISEKLNLRITQIRQVLMLLSEGSTVPFIARYRKERTGNLDEVEILKIKDEYERVEALRKRKEFVIDQIREQGKLTSELEQRILKAAEIAEVEDLYLPYKSRRKTRGDVAREKGLEPLAKEIFEQRNAKVLNSLKNYLNEKVATEEEALQGAQDIIAEWINEDSELRGKLRKLFENESVISSKPARGKKDLEEAQKFRDYFEHSELLKRCPGHRFLAMMRGGDAGFLKISVEPDFERAIYIMKKSSMKGYGPLSDIVCDAAKDAYARLLQPSLENEMLSWVKEKADEDAIGVFALNAQQLLLASPLGQKRVLALDPGFRTGCKLVCLSEYGDLLHKTTVFPHDPQREVLKSQEIIANLIEKYNIDALAVGNGTAGRETYAFLKNFIKDLPIYMVNEAGASIYSASEVARQEFPNEDVTVRGAVSIGRRLMDPLAELVKIDPKSIGVGQYQHDVNQSLLQKRLESVVVSAVNKVGINLNTASQHVLSYISGLGPALAKNIIEYRSKIGGFSSREELKKVPRLGDKAFEQCAGFLRVKDAKNPLDNSGVHPERYFVVNKMAQKSGVDVKQLIGNETLLHDIPLDEFINESEGLGLPTLQDIIQELKKPGADPRGNAEEMKFEDSVRSIADLEIGMELNGIVTNITNFGAFVDIGVKQDGLVHISHISQRFVKHPSEVVSLGQQVRVRVMEVDVPRKRINLTMKF